MDHRKTPFPWFGGKRRAAPRIWEALGDVPHYVEPFGGGLAALLHRPHRANRSYFSETVNDLDGLLVNAWRSIQLHPDATAEAASWPVSEADLHARHVAILKWRQEHELERLMGDPVFCDPMIGGWWMWGQSCWIGSGWCSGKGPWWPDESGRFGKRGRGVSRKRPHLGNDGQGVNRPQLREEGVSRQLPHLGNNGQGVNHAGLREEGVSRQLPHLGDDGKGVNRPQLREEGTEYHPITMPKLRQWFAYLSARLRHVRILNGDWKRSVTGGAAWTLPVRQGKGPCGVLLDPPYADTAKRTDGLYAHDSLSVAHNVREWCLEHGNHPRFRIVLAGFVGEHGPELVDAGWREIEWFTSGFLTGGMGNTSKTSEKHQQKSERIWLSPHCLAARQADLFG